MRFEAVHAHAFGPLVDEVLELAPGLTLVHGPNEAAKTTWHAALYAGLCGQRRGRGQPRAEERCFEAAHRPWTGSAWRVGARIRLDDGRRIELDHDLDGKVDCRALDIDLGRDLSGELIFEGAPDGSRLLGLDRKAFLATACVRQNDLLQLLEEPRRLHQYLERAAAAAAANGDAASALAAIDTFLAEQVGLDRAGAVRPLRRAKEAVAAAEAALAKARRQHAELLDLQARAAAAEHRADQAEGAWSVAAAGASLRQARAERARLERARELAAAFPEGPPAAPASETTREREVAAALQAWQDRPALSSAQRGGRTAAELERELAEERGRAAGSAGGETAAPDQALVVADRSLVQQVRSLRDQLGGLPRRRTLPALLAAGVLAAGGGLALAWGWWPVGGPLLLAAVAIGLWATWRAGNAGKVRLLEKLRDAEARLAQQSAREEEARLRREGNRERRARAAARLAELEHALAARRALEEATAVAQRRRESARAAILTAARGCGLGAEDEAEAVDGLRQWQRGRQADLVARQERWERWTTLQTLIGDRSLSELEAQVQAREEAAAKLAEGLAPARVEEASERGPGPDLEDLRHAAAEAREDATDLRARAAERASQAPEVPAAEETLALARTEVSRVEGLAETLRLTRSFLERARDRAHRSIAPVLRDSIQPWLATVTRGRYAEAAVDPESLQVTVRTAQGTWRNAASLSHGTTEQVYLLLRVALAEHLGDPRESCPLLLDDVTTHCDEERTGAVLELLHLLSAHRQVILFGQQTQVLHWGEAHLGPRDRLVRLERVPA